MDVVAAEAAPVLEDEAPSPPSGPVSPLAMLAGKRQALDAKLHLDLPVPRWDDLLGYRLWVRYLPGDPGILTSAVEKREKVNQTAMAAGKPGDKTRMAKANAEFLAAACDAVYGLGFEEEPPEGELPEGYPTFSSPELSEAVGAPPNAVETVRRVYATDGDVMVAASQLLEWSGQATPKAEADFLPS